MVAIVAITPMTLEDLAAVAALERLAKGGWTQEQLESQLAQPDGWQYVARRQTDNEPVVGYICGRNVVPEAEVYRIVVHEQCRRQGVGRMLMSHALEVIQLQGVQHCFLECRESNQAALQLYAGMGFILTGRRKNYYRDPREDAVLLRLSFSEGAIA